MTLKEAIEIIEVERACVKRNTDNKCDRDCINCDLLRTEEEIFAAYDMAIKALENRIPKKTNKVIDKTWGTKEELDVCPVCGCYIHKIYFFNDGKKEPCKKMSYCEHCGQAILWEE